MTPQQQDKHEAAQIDMDVASERVHRALHGDTQQSVQSAEYRSLDDSQQIALAAGNIPAGYHYAIKGPRKGQLIKDVVAAKEAATAPAPASGKLTAEDTSRLRDLMATVSGRRTDMDQAIARFEAAEEELDAWIADHTA